MSFSSCRPTMIDAFSLPTFSNAEKRFRQEDRIRRQRAVKKALCWMLVIAALAGRYLSDRAFDKRLLEDHRQLDENSHILAGLKQEAFVNNNYKNPIFRKTYLILHDENLKLRKKHIYQQTNTSWNILTKQRGVCPECKKHRDMGIDGYFRE